MTDLFGKPAMLETARVPEKRWAAQMRLARVRLSSLHRKYGNGPEGATCKDCAHLIRKGGNARIYLKCALYRVSGCEASDWRAKWPACGKFTPAERVAKKKAAPKTQTLTADELGAFLES